MRSANKTALQSATREAPLANRRIPKGVSIAVWRAVLAWEERMDEVQPGLWDLLDRDNLTALARMVESSIAPPNFAGACCADCEQPSLGLGATRMPGVEPT